MISLSFMISTALYFYLLKLFLWRHLSAKTLEIRFQRDKYFEDMI